MLPLLYLQGLSSQEFAPALEQSLGTGAGLSASTVIRLTTQWRDGARLFDEWPLADLGSYRWVDGIHVNVRLEQEKPCLLKMIGACADGRTRVGRVDRRVPGIHRVLSEPAV